MKKTVLKRKIRLRTKARLKTHRPLKRKPRTRRRRTDAQRKQTRKDAEWARKVKERDGWRCQVTGAYYGPGSGRASRGLEAAHIFSRNNPYVRHEIDDGVSLSYSLHRFWCHRQPAEFMVWVEQWMGKERFEALRKKAFQSGVQLGLDRFTQEGQNGHNVEGVTV